MTPVDALREKLDQLAISLTYDPPKKTLRERLQQEERCIRCRAWLREFFGA
jgi:hypothetical protein